MGYDIPGVGKDPNAVVSLTDPVIRGEMDVRGSISVDEVPITSKPEDLNLLDGLIAGAITTGLIKSFEKEVACPNGTAQTVAIVTIPAGSIILEVTTHCTEALNGDTTKTFEVGIAANTDKYIDPVDCPVTLNGVMSIAGGTNHDQKTAEVTGAAIPIIATYTNTANATTGKVMVKVVYA